MRIFVTGATGFIGSALVPELIGAGHQVLGLTRSDEGAERLKTAGAEVHRGDLEQPETLRAGAEKADAVIHLAFDHDFSRFQANAEKDQRNIAAMGDALLGSDRPLLITSGVGLGIRKPGELGTEDYFDKHHPNPRIASELAGETQLQRGVNVSVMRLPQVHDTEKQGLIPYFTALAKEKGVSAYVGEGTNRFAACHVSSCAQVYRLAIERGERGARWNAVQEEGVAMKPIAEALARGLKVPTKSLTPEEVPAHFGWMAMFAGADIVASSAMTQQKLGWKPFGPDLITDLNNMDYGV